MCVLAVEHACPENCHAVGWTPMSPEPEPAVFILDCDIEVVFIPLIPVEDETEEEPEQA
jgi:hypothetical protein